LSVPFFAQANIAAGAYAEPVHARKVISATGQRPAIKRLYRGTEPMVWLLNLYVVMSIVVSVSAAFHVGVAAGVCAVLTIAVALIAGGGLKATLFWGNTVQKMGGPVVTALLAILAYWLSGGVFGGPIQLSLYRRGVGGNRICDRFSVGRTGALRRGC
jgi:hypothetical protein